MKSLTLFVQLLLATLVIADEMTQPVMLQMGEMIAIDNGLVRLGISEDGRLQELSLRGGPNLASSGYWNANSNGYDAAGESVPPRFAVLVGEVDVVRQSDDLVEIAFVPQPTEPLFFQTALHYVLRRGESGFYLYMSAAHDAQMPAGDISQYAYNLRLNPRFRLHRRRRGAPAGQSLLRRGSNC
ncbi:MAG TPA: hypothetical protein DIC52_09080 [Candidatus Latescibacteria bacterium]|nr:hypothetical protein [Candidatus Latescibacterota bacterium]